MKNIRKINLELKKDIVSKLNDEELSYIKGGIWTDICIETQPTFKCHPQTDLLCINTMASCNFTEKCSPVTFNNNCNHPSTGTCPPRNTENMNCGTIIATINGCLTKNCDTIGC